MITQREPAPPTCICANGWITVFVIPPDWRTKLTASQSAMLIERHGDLDSVPEDRNPMRRSFACACLCGDGRNKLHRSTGVENHLNEDALQRLYGGHVPQPTRRHWPSFLVKHGVPEAWAERSLNSYLAFMGADKIAKRYAEWALAWSTQTLSGRTDIVFYGANGTGKSGLGVAILRASAEAGQSVAFVSVQKLSIEWRDTFTNDDSAPRISERDMLDRFVRPDVLMLDEFGQQTSDFIEQTITMIVDERQKQGKPTLLTMNVPHDLEEERETKYLAMIFGPTLFDRLRERGQFWPLRGASRRKMWKPPET